MFGMPSLKASFDPDGEGVLVTGCSSGIGRAVALHLAQTGFTVFATLRKPAGSDALYRLGEPNLVPVYPLDLAKREHIPAVQEMVAAELTRRGKKGLYALVNNAGAGSVAPIELMDLDKYQTELQARLLGPVALLQAFLPLIRARQGRVVWIMTPSLIPTPFVSSIHACDFAANCLARTLALELAPWRIPSIMVRCGVIATSAPAKNENELAESLKQWPPEKASLYAGSLRKLQLEFAQLNRSRTPPEAVARIVQCALSARNPRSRYQVGHLSRAAAFLEALPQPLADKIIAMRG